MSNQKSQAQKAYEKIRNHILTQKLKPGSPLVESEFAEQLKMSRTPVREAIRQLSADGLVEIIPRKGTFIKTFTKKDLIMCYEAAEGLEGMVVYLAAKSVAEGKADKSKVRAMEQLVEQMDKSLEGDNMPEWISGDEKFHDILYKMCDNTYIIQNLERILVQLNCVLWFITPMYIDKRASNEEHRKMVKAIKEGDAQGGRCIAQQHRNRVRSEFEKVIFSTIG